MFKKVLTNAELDQFNDIVKVNWKGEGFDEEYADGTSECYLYMASMMVDDVETLTPVGTVEIKHFNHKSNRVPETIEEKKQVIDDYFDFKKVEEIKSSSLKVIEIDKLSILDEHRGQKHMDAFLTLLMDYAEENQVGHYIALINPLLYLSLRRHYKIPIKATGEKFFYKGANVQPVMIDVKKAMEIKQKFSWYVQKENILN